MKIKLIIKKLLPIVMLLISMPHIAFALEGNTAGLNNNRFHRKLVTAREGIEYRVEIDDLDLASTKKRRSIGTFSKEAIKSNPMGKQKNRHKKRVSLTIDDLPFVGEYRNFHLNMIIETMTKEHVPATGFIIASEVRTNNWEILRKFKEAGFGLGNHTLNHANLNKMNTEKYIYEIHRADKILLPVLTEPKYFRYPYLAMSSGQKKEDILCYLAQKNYQVAPITIDSKDFVFNQRLLSVPEINRRAYLEELKPFYLDFIWQQTRHAEEHTQFHRNPKQAQILLIHANLLNAYVLPDIIHLYKKKGYTFISLEQALKTFKSPVGCAKSQVNAQIKIKNDRQAPRDKRIKTLTQ